MQQPQERTEDVQQLRPVVGEAGLFRERSFLTSNTNRKIVPEKCTAFRRLVERWLESEYHRFVVRLSS